MARNIHFDFDILMTRGDSRSIPIEFFDGDGNVEDISTWNFFYTAKVSLEDDDADAVIMLDPADLVPVVGSDGPTLSQIFIVLTHDITKDVPARDYFHDIKVINGAGTATYAMGVLTIEDGVTDRSAALAP